MKIIYSQESLWELVNKINKKIEYFQNLLDSKQLEVLDSRSMFSKMLTPTAGNVLLTNKSFWLIEDTKDHIRGLKKLLFQVEQFQFTEVKEIILSDIEVDSLTQELCTC